MRPNAQAGTLHKAHSSRELPYRHALSCVTGGFGPSRNGLLSQIAKRAVNTPFATVLSNLPLMALFRNREETVCCTSADLPNVCHPIKGEMQPRRPVRQWVVFRCVSRATTSWDYRSLVGGFTPPAVSAVVHLGCKTVFFLLGKHADGENDDEINDTTKSEYTSPLAHLRVRAVVKVLSSISPPSAASRQPMRFSSCGRGQRRRPQPTFHLPWSRLLHANDSYDPFAVLLHEKLREMATVIRSPVLVRTVSVAAFTIRTATLAREGRPRGSPPHSNRSAVGQVLRAFEWASDKP